MAEVSEKKVTEQEAKEQGKKEVTEEPAIRMNTVRLHQLVTDITDYATRKVNSFKGGKSISGFNLGVDHEVVMLYQSEALTKLIKESIPLTKNSYDGFTLTSSIVPTKDDWIYNDFNNEKVKEKIVNIKNKKLGYGDVALGAKVSVKRYEVLGSFKHPITNVDLSLILDRYFRDLLLVEGLDFFLEPYILEAQEAYNTPLANATVIHLGSAGNEVGIKTLPAMFNSVSSKMDGIDVENAGYLGLTKDLNDTIDVSDMKVGLITLNSGAITGDNYYNYILTTGNDKGNKNYVNRENKTYLILELGTLTKFMKPGSYDNLLNTRVIHTLIPSRTKYQIVRLNQTNHKLSLNDAKFCVIIDL